MYADSSVIDRTPSARRGESARPAPVVIVCSPRPRVGRTLIARLLAEFFISDGRRPVIFDVNPADPLLHSYLPGETVVASLDDIFDQVALFDRLIAADGHPKVVDLAPEHFATFFDVMAEIDFAAEARERSLETIILFVCENHPRSAYGYERLAGRFPQATLVQVHNEGIASYEFDDFPEQQAGVTTLRITGLSPMLAGVINRPGFSFTDYVVKHAEFPTGLHAWITRSFIAFRDLELRLMLEEFEALLQRA